MSIPDLIKKVTRAGYAIVIIGGVPTLKRQRGDRTLSAKFIEELKSRRDEILAWMTTAPEDSLNPQTAPATTTEPGPKSELTICQNCNAVVNPAILADPMTPLSICGRIATKQHKACPYQKPRTD